MVCTFGQTSIEGVFLDDRDTLNFHSDLVSLTIMSNGGLISSIDGVGEYSIDDDILIVKTGNNPNKPFQKKTPRELGDTKYLENEIIIFKINEQTKNRLVLILLGICGNKDFNGRRTIKKFERNHKKFIYRRRELNRKTNANKS